MISYTSQFLLISVLYSKEYMISVNININNFRFYKTKHEEKPDDVMAESRVKVSVELNR